MPKMTKDAEKTQIFRNLNNHRKRHVMNKDCSESFEWMFLSLRAEEKMVLSCQRASCIDDYFPQPISPLSHLNSTKEQQKV